MDIYSYEVVSNAFMVFVGFLGVVSLILSVIIAWRTFKKPYDERKHQLEEHSEKLDRDWETMQELKADMRILIQNDIEILDHIVTGNHVEKLKQRRDFIHRYLIDHMD